MKTNTNNVVSLLNTMSTDDLRATAKHASVKIGKSRTNTLANLTEAIDGGTLHVKVGFTLSTNPTVPGSGQPTQRKTFYRALLRTYKSGPGEENTVWQHATETAIAGSPAIPA